MANEKNSSNSGVLENHEASQIPPKPKPKPRPRKKSAPGETEASQLNSAAMAAAPGPDVPPPPAKPKPVPKKPVLMDQEAPPPPVAKKAEAAPPPVAKKAEAVAPQAKAAKPAAKPEPAKPAASQSAESDEEEEHLGRATAPSWGQMLVVYSISMILHVAVLVVLGYIILPADVREEILSVVVKNEKVIDTQPLEEPIEQPQVLEELTTENEITDTESLVDNDVDADSNFDLNINDLDLALKPDTTEGPSPPIDNIKSISQGRSGATRDALNKLRGGNAESDAAVGLGLQWLASVQRRDGSWDFNDVGKSSGAGSLSCPTGGTGLALLAFLGAGHTHMKKGHYQDTVMRGLNYLMLAGIRTPRGLDLRGQKPGNEGMYVQAICATALAEAYGMTKDRRLLPYAQSVTEFIVRAQHSEGGWRYKPNTAGDTSVVGWQVMALKSAYHAKIPIPRTVGMGVTKFLDDVSHKEKSQYSYMPGQGPKASTTSIGLLCRMYMGWKAENPALIEGVKYLAKVGPSKNDIYYDYYASQVMIQFTGARGELWTKWNTVMRDWLVATQKKAGPEKGSWDVIEKGHKGDRGGRLYTTCLAVMTLEIYYRVLPLYQRAAVEAEF